MTTPNTLPFELDQNSITQWLENLSTSPLIQVTNSLYSALKIINKTPLADQTELELLLNTLTFTTMQSCSDVEQLFCPKNNTPINTKHRKIARLSIRTLRYLAFLYYHLIINFSATHHESTTNKENILAVYVNRCIKICDECLKQSALINDRPSQEIWAIIGKLYQLACDKSLLETKTNDDITFFKQQNIIENIKIILLFSMCKPYRLQQKDITDLKSLINSHHDKLTINNQNLSSNYTHCWNYSLAYGVTIVTPSIDANFSTLYLDNHLLLKTLQENNFLETKGYLTAFQAQISHLAQALPLVKNISYGFDTISQVIEQYNRAKKIQGSFEKNLSILDKLELKPFEHEKTLEKAEIESIWKNDSSKNATHEAVIKESKHTNFALAELKSFAGLSEDIIIIYDGKKKPQLGIIRHISHLKNEVRPYQLLIEKISTELSSTKISYANQEYKAIISHSDKGSNLLFLLPNKYATGSAITSNEQSYTLTKLMECSVNFMLYEIQG